MTYIYIRIRGIIVYYILEINKHMNLITFQPHNYYEHGHIISIKLKSKFMSVHIHFMEYERAGYVGRRSRTNETSKGWTYTYVLYRIELVIENCGLICLPTERGVGSQI